MMLISTSLYYIRMCTHTHHTHTHVTQVSLWVYVCVYVCEWVYVSECVSECMWVSQCSKWVSVCVYVCVCVSMWVSVSVCVCVYSLPPVLCQILLSTIGDHLACFVAETVDSSGPLVWCVQQYISGEYCEQYYELDFSNRKSFDR